MYGKTFLWSRCKTSTDKRNSPCKIPLNFPSLTRKSFLYKSVVLKKKKKPNPKSKQRSDESEVCALLKSEGRARLTVVTNMVSV